MSNAVTLAELGKLAKGLASTPSKLQAGLDAATLEIRKLVTDEFNTKSNPWGRAWAPLKSGGGPARLIDTGELVDSIRIQNIGGAIRTTVGARYARYLQRGRKRLKTTGAAAAVIHQETLRGTTKHTLMKTAGLTDKVMRARTIVPFSKLPPTWALAIVTALTDELSMGMP